MALDLSGVVQDLCTEFGELGAYRVVTESYSTATSEQTKTTADTACNLVFYSDRKALTLLSRQAARGSVDTVEGSVPNLAAVVSTAQLVGITPKEGDQLVRADASVYTIESIAKDPTNSSFIFSLRRP